MKIGIVLPGVPKYSETFFRSKIVGLQQAGFDVILFVKNPVGAKEFICPVKVHPKLFQNSVLRIIQTFLLFLKLVISAPRATVRLIGLARKSGFSIMQSVKAAVIGSTILREKLDWLHFGFATPAIEREFLGAAIQAKVAVSFRGFDLNQTPLANSDVYKYLWPNIDKVHSISNYLVKKGLSLGLPSKVPFQIITPAIDIAAFSGVESNRIKNSVLLVSRLHWIKGIEYVLEAIKKAVVKLPDIKMTIVGTGEELERLTFAAYQLGIHDNVIFTGMQNHQDVAQCMMENEVFIQYSVQEGFCNAALEAQAAGMLCIVSDAEGLQENVLNEKTGWVVPKRSPKLLAQKIIDVILLPEDEKEKMRLASKNRVKREFNLEKQQKEFVAFYTDN